MIGRFTTERERATLLRVPKPIAVTPLTTSAAVIFTARTDADFQIEGLIASNVTGTAATVTVHVVPSGGSVALGNAVAFQTVVPANDTLSLFDRMTPAMLEPGATLRALCSVNAAINLFGWGHDYQGQYAE